MIVWRFTLNLAVVVADGNLFDACLIASNAAISNGDLKTVCPYLS
jgi:exosome complex RNA-binding protein Rrp42 (RNase PH superfamily)